MSLINYGNWNTPLLNGALNNEIGPCFYLLVSELEIIIKRDIRAVVLQVKFMDRIGAAVFLSKF